MGEKISHMKLSEETHAPGVFSPEVDFPQLRRTEPRFRRHFGAGRFISYGIRRDPMLRRPFLSGEPISCVLAAVTQALAISPPKCAFLVFLHSRRRVGFRSECEQKHRLGVKSLLGRCSRAQNLRLPVVFQGSA